MGLFFSLNEIKENENKKHEVFSVISLITVYTNGN